MHEQPGVAPPDLIRQDFKVLDSRETLRTTWVIEELLLMQSIQGHAHEGHGIFKGRRFPNTSMDDITSALRLDPVAIKAERQAIIDSVLVYLDRVIKGDMPPALIDEEGNPLLGISTLRFIRVNPEDVARGFYLGGLRDDSEVRKEVEDERNIKIGGGKAYFVDYNRMHAMHIGADELAKGEWADQIGRFHREKLIVDGSRADEPGVVYQYIRHRKGPGASDDAAIVAAGYKWGLGVAVGVFFADAVDTLEKYVPVYSDQDENIALHLEESFSNLKMGRPEVKELTWMAASPDEAGIRVPDSSLRHLLAIDRRTDLCAIESHLLSVEGVPAPVIGLSHDRTPSDRFYAYLRERIKQE